ncbi:MAG: phosphoribosylamine--glycine ligase [Pseudomonadota bacterium]
MNILLVGSGGREHALAWKLSQSSKCDKLFCAPGNAGIANVAECVDVSAEDQDGILKFVEDNQIDFVVVGPEQPLVEGLGSKLRAKNIPVFGPNTEAAQLEGSKGFMKDFCARHNIPTAAYARFKSAEDAKNYVAEQGAPIVLKTDGLAAGKGVIIAQTVEEAHQNIDEMMSGQAFGSAGEELVIEEFMDGEELSYFALSDGNDYLALTSAQDHKRVGDGDTGPNTGGMGAYSPARFMDDVLEQKILNKIIAPTVEGMKKDGMPFQGIFFAGLMIQNGEPRLIEYNIRFGDPECQPIMMRLESDLVDILLATDKGNLAEYKSKIQWSNQTALCVVMAADGYPGSYQKGTEIKNTTALIEHDNVNLFHAGTMLDNSGALVNTGGRVLGVVGLGNSTSDAQAQAYKGVDLIDWPEGFCRRDIGWRDIEREKAQAA